MSSYSLIPRLQRYVQRIPIADYLLLDMVLGGLVAAKLGVLPAPLDAAVALVLGLIVVLFAPGYLLTTLFFPLRTDLRLHERVALAVGLSLALHASLILGLDHSPWRIESNSLLIALGGLMVLLQLLGGYVRSGYAHETVYAPRFSGTMRLTAFQLKRWGPILTLFAFLCQLGGWIMVTPAPEERMTEIYLLDASGSAENYPTHIFTNQPITSQIIVHNREGHAQSYRVELWVEDPWSDRRVRQLTTRLDIEANQTAQTPLMWAMPWDGNGQKVDILLFYDDETTTQHQLQLWLDVSNPTE